MALTEADIQAQFDIVSQWKDKPKRLHPLYLAAQFGVPLNEIYEVHKAGEFTGAYTALAPEMRTALLAESPDGRLWCRVDGRDGEVSELVAIAALDREGE
jgi:hypothetical protein